MSDHYCCKRCGLRYDDCTCGATVSSKTKGVKRTGMTPSDRLLAATMKVGKTGARPPVAKRSLSERERLRRLEARVKSLDKALRSLCEAFAQVKDGMDQDRRERLAGYPGYD